MHNLDRTHMETWDFESFPGSQDAYEGGGWSEEAESGWYDEGEGGWYEGEEEGYFEGEGDWYEGEGDGYFEGEGGWYDEGEEGWYEGEEEDYFEGEGDWYAEGEDAWYEGEAYDDGEAAWYGEDGYGAGYELPFEEVDEMAIAAEFLNVGSEQEFDRLLKGVISHAARAFGRKGSSNVFGRLRKMLKGFGRQILPLGGAALGNLVAPGVGGAIGGSLIGRVGRLFGLETEGMSPEDEQYEVARRYVRFVGAAAQEAAQMPPNAPPEQIAQRALVAAAQRHAPGMIAAPGAMPMQPRAYRRRYPGARQGVWTRRGNAIILHGIR